MILINGNIHDSSETKVQIRQMRRNIVHTLARPVLDPMIVIEACHTLVTQIVSGTYDDLLEQITKDQNYSRDQILSAIHSFQKENLLHKMNVELGSFFQKGDLMNEEINIKRFPLGVLFHIAAGNIDVLPVYSIVEGLLVGNINILKLPASDHGLTITLLSKLIEIEPMLSEYIYVFDTPSNDLDTLKEFAALSDAVVVWGGKEAVQAARTFVGVDKKIIEWGHKISFAYVTKAGMEASSLNELAEHIFQTNQLLCSSCQGIYVDTEYMEDVYSFGQKFLKVMEEASVKYPPQSIGITAQLTLMQYNKELSSISSDVRVYRGKGCSVIASSEQELTSSYMFGNCWVKPLPRRKIIQKLYSYRGYLQTVGLLCGSDERTELSDILARAGVSRIRNNDNMSDMIYGEAHDGEYPLLRYSRVVEWN